MERKDNKFLMLFLSLLLDALGYVSFLIPGLGNTQILFGLQCLLLS